MTMFSRIACIAAAAMMFVPVAMTVLHQAAQIV